MNALEILRRTPFAVAACLTTACFSGGPFNPETSFAPTNASPRPVGSRAPESVQVFTVNAPTEPFVEIGVVDVHTTITNDQDSARLMAELRRRAAQHGCDALYNLKSHDRSAGSAVGNFLGFQATCIVYRDEKYALAEARAAAVAASASAAAPDPNACKDAADYDERAAKATNPGRAQLEKIAARKHTECDALQHPRAPVPAAAQAPSPDTQLYPGSLQRRDTPRAARSRGAWCFSEPFTGASQHRRLVAGSSRIDPLSVAAHTTRPTS